MVPADLGILPNSVDIMPTKFGHFPGSNTSFRTPSFTEQAKFPYSIVASTNSSSITGPHVVDNNHFSDSLAAGWWNNTILGSDTDQSQLLNLPETLSSIFNSFPKEIESLASSSSSSMPESEVETCNTDIPNPQFLLNELQCVVNSTPKLAVDNNATSVLNSTASTVFARGNKPSPATLEHEKIKPETMPISNMLDSVSHSLVTSSPMSVFNERTHDSLRKHFPIPDNAFAVSGMNPSFNTGVIQASESICTQVKPPSESSKCSSTSRKRPSSIFTFSNGPSSPNSWNSQMGFISSKEHIMNHCHVLDSTDTMLYKTNRDNHHGLQYYMTVEDGTVCLDEELMIKPPPPKARKRHGTAMDPQSIAARSRRERFSDRIRILQSLIPNGERLDTVSMLGQTLEYVRFLQHQVWQLYNGMEPATPNNVCEKWKDFVEADSASKK